MVWKWRDYEGVVARLVPKTDIHGILKQDIIVGPGEAVVIIRNGKIEDTVTQTRLEKIGGGLGTWITRTFGAGEDLELLFVDAKELDIELPINEKSKDYDEVKGTATVRVKINPMEATKLIGILRDKPLWVEELKQKGIIWKRWETEKKYAGNVPVLLKDDLEDKLGAELKSKVFTPYIAQYPSKDVRVNPEVREKVESSINVELRKTLDMWGITLLNFYLMLEASAYEALEKYRREKDLEMAKTDIDFAPRLRELDRQHSLATKTMEHAFELRRMGILQEEDVKDISQERNLKRQTELLNFKELERTKTLDVEWKEHIEDMKEMFGEEYIKKYGVPGVLDIKDRMDQLKRAREAHEADLRIKEFQETQLAMERLKQETEREKAGKEAEKEKYKLETYKEAEERERKHEVERRKADAELMRAAKQEMPRTLVQGPATPVVSIREEIREKEETVPCPHCGEPLKKGWKTCPSCGEKV